MVSSDFGKLEVRRHLISGEDCAIAGAATAVAAAPAAETFKKSRRFIVRLLLEGRFPVTASISSGGALAKACRGALARPLTRKQAPRKRDNGMTAPIKRKSDGAAISLEKQAHAAAMTPRSGSRTS